MRVLSGSSPHSRGSIREAKASNWARPMVATVRISRGDRKNRRTMASSTRAHHQRRQQAEDQPQQVADAREDDQVERQCGGDQAQVALREVDDPVGPVDEGHAQGHEGREQAEREALQHQPPQVAAVAAHAGEQHLLHGDDGEGRADRGQPGAGAPLHARHPQRPYLGASSDRLVTSPPDVTSSSVTGILDWQSIGKHIARPRQQAGRPSRPVYGRPRWAGGCRRSRWRPTAGAGGATR